VVACQRARLQRYGVVGMREGGLLSSAHGGLLSVRRARVLACCVLALGVWLVFASAACAAGWTSYSDGPAHGLDGARSMVLSPDGTVVYVTGASEV
jgi:hypothetical protein